MWKSSILLLAVTGLTSCLHMKVERLTRDMYPPTTKSVQVFHTAPPAGSYMEIAIISIAAKDDGAMILADKAGELGADAIILLPDEQAAVYMAEPDFAVPLMRMRAVAIRYTSPIAGR